MASRNAMPRKGEGEQSDGRCERGCVEFQTSFINNSRNNTAASRQDEEEKSRCQNFTNLLRSTRVVLVKSRRGRQLSAYPGFG